MSKRRVIRSTIFTALFILSGAWSSVAQNTRQEVQNQIFSDTLGVSKSFQKEQLKSNALYDTILHSKSGFVRWIGNLLIGARSSADDSRPIPEMQISRDYFDHYQGKIITGIYISQANIFGQTKYDDLSWVERTMNNLHVRTREKVIYKNLMFHIGDKIDPYLMSVNEQMLRNKDYLSTAFFVIIDDPENPNGVQVNVFARDNWSISASGAWGGSPYLDAFDRNFIGSGNMLLLRYYGQRGDQRVGFEADYIMDNIWGTFATAKVRAGVGATNNALQLIVDKGYIFPSDHIWGLRAGYANENNGMPVIDTTMAINIQQWGGYYGYAASINHKLGTTIYSTAAANYFRFDKAPYRDATNNPAYSDRFIVTMNVGISRQNFFQGNMIYGYGRIEDIPYGFKFEINGGWENNFMLGRRWYAGFSAGWGGLTKIGYFNLAVQSGTFIKPTEPLTQAMANGTLRYFSPLFQMGNVYMRQFLNINYTQGFNRLEGERERLNYGAIDIRGMGVPWYDMGVNRFVASAESVFFTPLFLYHFRFAFFAWGDAGWLGMSDNPFKNPFAAAVGIGARIKNERLIFNNIQLRIGFSMARLPGAGFNWLQIGNEQALGVSNFVPAPPAPYKFE